MTATKRYPNAIDPILGYAPGTILTDDLADYRSVRAAEEILLHRYRREGFDGVKNVMMLSDNCETPDWFRGPEYRERYLANKLAEQRLDALAKAHMGGDAGFGVMAFNRTTSANLTIVLALARPGTVVPYVVPKYARPGLKGHGHPSIPRAIELARATTAVVVALDELEAVVARDAVSLIAVCPSYRGIVPEEITRGACALGRGRGIPVFVDDASGARVRVVGEGQARAIDLGADVTVTSCEKYGLLGPRAAVVVARLDLLERIGARAAVLGTEARPSVTAAIVRCFEAWTPERGEAMYREWERLHRPLWEAMRRAFGDRVWWKPYGGVWLMPEDVLEIAMERAGIDDTEVAPVDAATVLAMILLRRHGWMTLPALHYPGASKSLTIHMAQPAARTLSPEAIVHAIDDGLTALAKMLGRRDRLEAMLFGGPDEPIPA
jgi:L-seryl-tRNA(Ser) seleniumtransferase